MISQFFVLSQRGDNIVFRDYRGEVQKGSAEIFFRKVKFWKGDEGEDAPPVFNADGVNYVHVKVAGLLFVATTRVNVSPSLVLELLQRIARVIKDYLGVLNEDSLRKNFVLVYELLDEVIDFGYPQTTSTEVLKSYIFNEPIEVEAARLPPLGPAAMFMQGTKRMPGTAVTKSVVANEPGGRKREEIFVDIIEKISVTFSSSGYILTSEIDGTIQQRSRSCNKNPRSSFSTSPSLSQMALGPKPISSPVSDAWYPALAFLLIASGLAVTSMFFIYEATSSRRNRSLSKELTTGAVASVFLGFGSLFLLLSTGVYV